MKPLPSPTARPDGPCPRLPCLNNTWVEVSITIDATEPLLGGWRQISPLPGGGGDGIGRVSLPRDRLFLAPSPSAIPKGHRLQDRGKGPPSASHGLNASTMSEELAAQLVGSPDDPPGLRIQRGGDGPQSHRRGGGVRPHPRPPSFFLKIYTVDLKVWFRLCTFVSRLDLITCFGAVVVPPPAKKSQIFQPFLQTNIGMNHITKASPLFLLLTTPMPNNFYRCASM